MKNTRSLSNETSFFECLRVKACILSVINNRNRVLFFRTLCITFLKEANVSYCLCVAVAKTCEINKKTSGASWLVLRVPVKLKKKLWNVNNWKYCATFVEENFMTWMIENNVWISSNNNSIKFNNNNPITIIRHILIRDAHTQGMNPNCRVHKGHDKSRFLTSGQEKCNQENVRIFLCLVRQMLGFII